MQAYSHICTWVEKKCLSKTDGQTYFKTLLFELKKCKRLSHRKVPTSRKPKSVEHKSFFKVSKIGGNDFSSIDK